MITRKTKTPLNDELQFLLEMYCRGSVYMTVKWVLNGMKAEPEEMSQALVDAIPPKLAEILREVRLL